LAFLLSFLVSLIKNVDWRRAIAKNCVAYIEVFLGAVIFPVLGNNIGWGHRLFEKVLLDSSVFVWVHV
jgi:hypothetical protein